MEIRWEQYKNYMEPVWQQYWNNMETIWKQPSNVLCVCCVSPVTVYDLLSLTCGLSLSVWAWHERLATRPTMTSRSVNAKVTSSTDL